MFGDESNIENIRVPRNGFAFPLTCVVVENMHFESSLMIRPQNAAGTANVVLIFSRSGTDTVIASRQRGGKNRSPTFCGQDHASNVRAFNPPSKLHFLQFDLIEKNKGTLEVDALVALAS